MLVHRFLMNNIPLMLKLNNDPPRFPISARLKKIQIFSNVILDYANKYGGIHIIIVMNSYELILKSVHINIFFTNTHLMKINILVDLKILGSKCFQIGWNILQLLMGFIIFLDLFLPKHRVAVKT